MSQPDLIGCDVFALVHDEGGELHPSHAPEKDEAQLFLQWDDPEALRLPFDVYLERTGCNGTLEHREALYCAYYGTHSTRHNRHMTAKARAEAKAERQAKREAWKKWRKRRRESVQWNHKNRHRRARSFNMINLVTRYLVRVLQRGGTGALVPLTFAVGPLGHIQRRDYHLNAIERAWRACFRTKNTPCAATQRKIRAAVLEALAAEGVEFLQRDGDFLCTCNSNDPFTRGYYAERKSKNDNIPQGGRVKKVAVRTGTETRHGLHRKLAWKASRGALACARRHYPGCKIAFSFKHVYPWLVRNLQRGYDLAELVRLYKGDDDLAIFRRWEAKATDAGATGFDPWKPSGLMRDLQNEVEASLEPFWAMDNEHGRKRRAKRRADVEAAKAFILGGSNPFGAAKKAEREANA